MTDPNRTMQDVIQTVTLSEYSEAQLEALVDTLTGTNKTHFKRFLQYVLQFIEYNRSRYLQVKHDLIQIKEELASLRDDVHAVVASGQIPTARSTAFQPFQATTQQDDATVDSSTYAPVRNADGSISRKMGQVGNNVTVTFSKDDDTASKKSKLFGSSAKIDVFTGLDMNQFPEWVAQFLSGINLFQPTEPNACRLAIHLLRGKAAEMAKTIPQNHNMSNLQDILTALDKLFNTTGNRIVAVNIFNSFSQREDVSVQDYSIRIEHLFYRAYPGVDPDTSIFLMDRFISGLVSPQIKEKLRIPPQPTNFRDAVNSAMAYTAAIFPEHQTLRQKSLIWKMAASCSHPLQTKSIHNVPMGSINMVDDLPDGDHSILTLRQWCSLHKSDKHSDSDCRVQKETTASSGKQPKKRPPTTKKDIKPRRLRFKSKTDKKKFLRSIEDTEGVSIESCDSDDEGVVAQSLMQLDEAQQQDDSEDEENEDFHILVMDTPPTNDTDVMMEDSEFESALLHDPFTEELDSAVTNMQLEGELSTAPATMTPQTGLNSLNSLEPVRLESPTVSIPQLKVEENPFSPSTYSPDTEMYPSLPSPQRPGPAPAANPLPHGPLLYRGVYYMPIPAPHNIVVAQSTIPSPTKVPCADQGNVEPSPKEDPKIDSEPSTGIPQPVPAPGSTEHSEPEPAPIVTSNPETKDEPLPTNNPGATDVSVNQGFSVPSAPAPKKENKRSRGYSRSPSHSRSSSQHRRETLTSSSGSESQIRRSRGKNKRTVDINSSPLVASASKNHLGHVTRPKQGLTVTVPPEDGIHLSEVQLPFTPVLAHLAPLEQASSQELDVTKTPTPGPQTVVEFPTDPLPGDSDVDLDTGDSQNASIPNGIRLTYDSNSILEDHRAFASTVLDKEPEQWDRLRVDRNPSQFYQEYFLDQQKIHDVRSKGHSRIQAFNVRVTRQEPQSPTVWMTSSKEGKEKLEAKFKQALTSLYDAFEMAYQFEHPEFISDLRNHLVKTAVTQITSLYASSRCRTCYRGRQMDAAWRRSRFDNLLPFMAEVPHDSYKKAEDYQASVLLEKTTLIPDGPRNDRYRLGLTLEDQKRYSSLPTSERKSFDAELANLAGVNSLIRMSKRGEIQKDTPPSLCLNLTHASYQKIRQLRRQNMLPVAQALLQRYHDRQTNLVSRFGKLSVRN